MDTENYCTDSVEFVQLIHLLLSTKISFSAGRLLGGICGFSCGLMQHDFYYFYEYKVEVPEFSDKDERVTIIWVR